MSIAARKRAGDVEDRPIFVAGRFKAGKVALSDSMYKAAVATLRMLPAERTERDLRVFQPLHAVPAVKKLSVKARETFFHVARLRELYSGEYLFALGTKPSACYMVLRGRVNILLSQPSRARTRDAPGESATTRESSQATAGSNAAPASAPASGAGEGKQQQQQQQQQQQPKAGEGSGDAQRKNSVSVVAELDELRVVGEAALNMEEPDVTKVAARCTTDCVCLMVRREDYVSALREYMTETTAQTVMFLRQVPLFQNWPRQRLYKLARKTHDETFGPGELIIKQGGPATALYFVRVGHIRHLRSVEVREEGRAGRAAKMETRVLQLERSGPRSFFGEACAIRQDNHQPNTVQALTNVVLLVLPAADYRDVLRLYPAVRKSIQEYLDRRYPSDHSLSHSVPGLRSWTEYKAGVTQRISRKAMPLSQIRFGRAPALPPEPRDSVVDLVHAEEDVFPFKTKLTSPTTNFFRTSPRRRRPVPADVEPGLLAIRARYKQWQATEWQRKRVADQRAREAQFAEAALAAQNKYGMTMRVEDGARVDTNPAVTRARINALLNDLVNAGPYNNTQAYSLASRRDSDTFASSSRPPHSPLRHSDASPRSTLTSGVSSRAPHTGRSTAGRATPTVATARSQATIDGVSEGGTSTSRTEFSFGSYN